MGEAGPTYAAYPRRKGGFRGKVFSVVMSAEDPSGMGVCAACVVKPGCPQEHTINFNFLLQVIY